MNEIQIKKPEYSILLQEQNLILKTLFRLNKRIFRTNNYEKRFCLINKLTIQTEKMKRVNAIANYLDSHQAKFGSTPEKITELSKKLLEDDNAYKRALKIDKRRKRNYEL
ncbi:MAG: hypothetical protein IKA36_00530 [Clostridia bacterium]|nr:hypothetical protein [Clostridia bacterium]